jgi:hypothetical protein
MLVSAQQQAGRQAGDKARQPAKKKQNHAKVTFIRKKNGLGSARFPQAESARKSSGRPWPWP